MKADLLRDHCPELPLKRKDAAQFAVVARRPDLNLVASANQPGHDAQLAFLLTNRTLD